jgi:signal transduction histidine kinase
MSSDIKNLHLEIERLRGIINKNQRLWLAGSMMGNFIHDLNNPLTSINGNIELLLINPVVADPKIKKRVDTINSAVKRLTNKLRDMQLFTKDGRADLLVDINEICQEAARVAEYLPKPIKLPININLSNKTLICNGNPNQLAQAILMLIDNASDSALTGANPKVTLSTNQTEANEILIKITNNGPMIKPEVAAKMFEPSFSTKPGALGLGLTLAREGVLANSGKLTYTTSPEETEFLVTLLGC